MLVAAPTLARILAVAALGITAFAAALVLPTPGRQNEQRERVMAQVDERFPGWTVVNLVEAQENSWVVALECSGRDVGFRLLRDARPVDGLPATDYWIAPDDASSRETLRQVTEEIGSWLVWRGSPRKALELPCEASTE